MVDDQYLKQEKTGSIGWALAHEYYEITRPLGFDLNPEYAITHNPEETNEFIIGNDDTEKGPGS